MMKNILSAQTYYDFLDLRSSATQDEIQENYLKAKATYKKDSLALYSLYNSNETSEILARIEEAYRILSHPESRREYDLKNGFITPKQSAEGQKSFERKILSIDKAQPFTSRPSVEDVFSATMPITGNTPLQESILKPSSNSTLIPSSVITSTDMNSLNPNDEWSGNSLKKIRESHSLSLEDLSAHTKISKTYLVALESESFHQLPAPVFVRGFLIQICKKLNIAQEPLIATYLSRLNASREAK
jgi:DnaJ-class molecular chaperone